MTEDEKWALRGIYSQIVSTQASVVDAIASEKLTENRIRDLKRALTHIVEQLDHVREG